MVDVEEVLRYFVVHNFICNGDSYTGAMIHNYYLYEENGQMSMIPWDYNLGFGTFEGSNASGVVNTSIDAPVSGGSVSDRPMLAWIINNEEYLSQYHTLMQSFVDSWFSDGQMAQKISDLAAMLRPYVESDPTKFCTLEEYDAAVETISSFVTLRAEAVSRQLAGDTTAVDVGDLSLENMGTMNGQGGGMGGSFPGGQGGPGGDFDPSSMPQGGQNGSFDPSSMPQGGANGNFDPSSMPQGGANGSFDPSSMPQGGPSGSFAPGNMPQGGQGTGDNASSDETTDSP